jgi:hypothetical protein
MTGGVASLNHRLIAGKLPACHLEEMANNKFSMTNSQFHLR